MTKPFKISTHIQALPAWKQVGARLQLGHWLKRQGQHELSAAVMGASSFQELTPHLPKIDNLVSNTVTEQEIFPKVFTDPVTLRHDLTAMIGGSVRRVPRDATQPSIDERIDILKELLSRIEAAEAKLTVPRKKTLKKSLTEQMKLLLEEDPSSEGFEDKLDALVIEGGGYAIGITGELLDESVLDGTKASAERAVDESIYGALYFMDAVKRGDLYGAGCLSGDERQAVDQFLKGAAGIWGKTPKFIETLARYWARFSLGESTEKTTRAMGLASSRITEPRLELALTARLYRSILITTLHLLEVEKYIYARGWLKGYSRYHEGMASGAWALYLRKNASSIINRAIKIRNPNYTIQAAASLPHMVGILDQGEKKLNDTLVPILQANRATIISHALHTGKLAAHAEATVEAIPAMVEALDQGAEKLDDKLKPILQINRGSIISHAFSCGKLTAYVKAVMDAIPGIVEALDEGEENLDDELKPILQANRATIINHALHSGKLTVYAKAAVDVIPAMVEILDESEKELDDQLALILQANRGSIISHAFHLGRLTAYAKVAVDAIPAMVKALDDGKKNLDNEQKPILHANSSSIISHALASGNLAAYVKEAVDAIPAIAEALDKGEKQLDDTLTPILQANRASIIYYALKTGKFVTYAETAVNSIPDIIKIIDQGEEELDDKLKPILQANRASIISYALGSGKLAAYIKAAMDEVPTIVEALDQGEKTLDDALVPILQANRATIINYALRSGKLTAYAKAAVDVIPAMVEILDEGEKELDDQLAPILQANRATIIYHALASGLFAVYAKAAVKALPSLVERFGRTRSLSSALANGQLGGAEVADL